MNVAVRAMVVTLILMAAGVAGYLLVGLLMALGGGVVIATFVVAAIAGGVLGYLHDHHRRV